MWFGRTFTLACLMVAASAASALACSCARDLTAESILESAYAVFTGVAQSSRPLGGGESLTIFQVTESFKGVEDGTSIVVRHPSGSSASCGVQFSAGSAYTLSAFSRDGGLAANLCSAWMFMPQAQRDELIERLRELRGNDEQEQEEDESDQ